MALKARRKNAVTLSAVATTGAGSTVDFGAAPIRDIRYYIKATAVTTGATIKWEVSYDGLTWFVWGSSVTVNATGNTAAPIQSTSGVGLPQYWRANITARTDGTYTVYLGADYDF